MPVVDYLVASSFHALGMCLSSGMGQAPLTWQEVHAYSIQSGVCLGHWESVQIIEMSRQYCSWHHKGKKPDCVSPWNDNSPEALQANRDRVAAEMATMKAKRNEKKAP